MSGIVRTINFQLLTCKEVNISFNLTISLEDALALLSRCNQKTSVSVHSAKSTKKANPPKRQSVEKVPTFKKVPIPTLRRVLAAVSEQYGESIFRYGDAVAVASKLGIGKTSLNYATQYALQQGEIRRVGLGMYTFKAKAKYEPDTLSLLDIIASQEQTNKLLSVFRLLANVGKTAALYVNERGIYARFFANQDRTSILSVFLGKGIFDVFHVNNVKHARLQVSPSSLLEAFPKGRKGDFHLKIVKQTAAFMKVGILGNEHFINLLGCEQSESPYEVETQLEEIKDYTELQLPHILFRDILNDVRVHSPVVRILVNKEGAVIDSSFESKGYSKTLVPDNEVKISAPFSVEQCFSIESILPFLKNKVADTLTLKINRQCMMMELAGESGLQVMAYISSCKVETASTTEKVTRQDFKDLKERVAKLQEQMGV